MTRHKTLRFVLTVFGSALLSLAVMVLLPHDKYLRYKDFTDHQTSTAPWIYERIHFDQAPINIAFIGTSRTGMSIHTRRLEERLAEQHINVKAANLHIVKTGRNMHYSVVKELLESRPVDLIVLEITELEDRKPHPDYIYLADAFDILFAPLVINLRYFEDLVRLPGRQMDLFGQTVANKLGLRDDRFDASRYQGSNLDRAQQVTAEDGKVYQRNDSHTLEEMEAMRRIQEADDTPPLSSKAPFFRDFFSDLEFRFPRLMMNRIIDLAESKGTKIVLLYIPRYGGPAEPPSYKPLFSSRVALINPKPVLDSYSYWSDVPHVNWEGAQRLTDYVAKAIAEGGYFRPETELHSERQNQKNWTP